MKGNDVNESFVAWQKGEADLTFNKHKIYDNYKEFMKYQLGVISNLIDEDGWEAFGELNMLISFVNLSASIYDPIIKMFKDWVNKIKDLLGRLARKLSVNGYSIGISGPIGISISLSYSI